MTPFDLLLTGLTLTSIGLMCVFAELWRREIMRHQITRASRDGLRHMLAEIARRRDDGQVADAIVRQIHVQDVA